MRNWIVIRNLKKIMIIKYILQFLIYFIFFSNCMVYPPLYVCHKAWLRSQIYNLMFVGRPVSSINFRIFLARTFWFISDFIRLRNSHSKITCASFISQATLPCGFPENIIPILWIYSLRYQCLASYFLTRRDDQIHCRGGGVSNSSRVLATTWDMLQNPHSRAPSVALLGV